MPRIVRPISSRGEADVIVRKADVCYASGVTGVFIVQPESRQRSAAIGIAVDVAGAVLVNLVGPSVHAGVGVGLRIVKVLAVA